MKKYPISRCIPEPLPFCATRGSVLPLIKKCFAGTGWVKQAETDLIENPTFRQLYGVANVNGDLVGLIGWYRVPKYDTIAGLSYFCAHPTYQGEALGWFLFNWLCLHLKNEEKYQTLEIHCSLDLPKGMAFYERVGCTKWPKYKAIQRLSKNDVCYRYELAQH